jgi:ubiquinone/menaquinone biosynthesis C-methylase UbiE
MVKLLSESFGQNKDFWTSNWQGHSPESEIMMWDFYGLRPLILKYTPRNGKTMEAGCGMGRYNFLLSLMGINIEGIDFSRSTIDYLNEWKKKYNFKNNFLYGDITSLPYDDESLNGYLSLGVLEHFIEGPQKALKETYRILRPGGIAIITTPNKSFRIRYQNLKKAAKSIVKSWLHLENKLATFFQYEYSPIELKKFIDQSRLKVTNFGGKDLLYALVEIGKFSGNNINQGSFGYWFSDFFENTIVSYLGAQSYTISVKVADKMHCFFCNDLSASMSSLKIFDVPVCAKCKENNLHVNYYKRNKIVKYSEKYLINPPILKPENRLCSYCNGKYLTHQLFEDFGFNINVCPICIQKSNVNFDLSLNHLKPLWRPRGIN